MVLSVYNSHGGGVDFEIRGDKYGVKRGSSINDVPEDKLRVVQRAIRLIQNDLKSFNKPVYPMNEIFGFSVADKFTNLDPNNGPEVEKLFRDAYKNILINPHMSSIGVEAKRETPQEKYALLQQYVDGNGGSLRLDKNGKLVYISAQQQSKGISTPKAGGSTGLSGI